MASALAAVPSGLKAQVSALLSSSASNSATSGLAVPGRSSEPLTDLSVENLRFVIEENHAKVTDLFRAWDEDKNGKVSKKEFRKGLVALGFEATVDQVNASGLPTYVLS
jgi:hypothetical protein